MAKIVLISCASKKRTVRSKAKEMYDKSPLFRKSLEYAGLLKPDKIYILSAKHGLLGLEKEIDPYDETLSYLSAKQRAKKPNVKVLSKEEKRTWSDNVVSKLRGISNLNKDNFIFLAGKDYWGFLIPHITNYEIPMEHIGIVNRQPWLCRKISNLKKQI